VDNFSRLLREEHEVLLAQIERIRSAADVVGQMPEHALHRNLEKEEIFTPLLDLRLNDEEAHRLFTKWLKRPTETPSTINLIYINTGEQEQAFCLGTISV